MAQLFLANMHSSTKTSTETIFEIKAPLATFDTVDLDDDALSIRSLKFDPLPSQSEKAIGETVESGLESQGSSFDSSSGREPNIPTAPTSSHLEHTTASTTVEPSTAAPDSTKVGFESDSSNTVNSENDNASEANASTNDDMLDAHSSENNATAEEIQTQLKLKGRKHKEKATNVKYEKIDSSDVSDQDKSANASPVPRMKVRMDKVTYTDSDSSDSDEGYIRGGFISTGKGPGHTKPIKPRLHYVQNAHFGFDSVDSDSTPCSSPKTTPRTVPPPLSKEDAEKKSKRKAYEKRLQRLQVTNNPIERPRSTTPINVFGLEEYVNISSPEKSPSHGSLEKLKIKLPLDETCRGRSPRRAGAQKCSDSSDVFSFNEDLLFTHTKSAILVENDGSKGMSPKRILVPPTLSPKLSPARSPRTSRGDTGSLPRYYLSPFIARQQGHNRGGSLDIKPDFFTQNNENWANFDDMPNKNESIKSNGTVDNDLKADTGEVKIKPVGQVDCSDEAAEKENKENKGSIVDANIGFPCETFVSAKEKELNTEEILTINITGMGDFQTCDIKCDVVDNRSVDDSINRETTVEQSHMIEDEFDSLC